jgi:transposase
MQTITTIGLDIAKSVFQVHGVDAEGNFIFRRQLKRRYMLSFFLPEAAIVSDRYRSLRVITSLVARAPGAWPHRSPDAAGLRQALCEAAQERCH